MNKNTQMQTTTITSKGVKIGNYLLEKKLGEGQFGSVWKARQLSTNQIFAIKKIKKKLVQSSSNLIKLLNTEITIMHQINHPNILHLFEYIESLNNYYLVLQFCNQGDFENYMKEKSVKSFKEKEAVYFLKQIFNGFAELRKKHILHRDFKLANIFMHDECLIIGDFGFAKMGADFANSMLGSPLTMAPELLLNEAQNVTYSSKADLWSVGIVFYQMLFGQPPFDSTSVPALKQSIKRQAGNKLVFPKEIDAVTKDFLIKLLIVNPEERINWQEAFDHPIFQKFENKETKLIKKLFGPQGASTLIQTNQQFQENRNSGNVFEKVFNDFELKDLQTDFKAFELKEELISIDQNKAIQAQKISKEVYFRYCHEINKIMLIIYCVRRNQNFLKLNILPKINEKLLNISILLVKKAHLKSRNLMTALQQKKNIFQLNLDSFYEFYKSQELKEINNYNSINYYGLQKHLLLLVERYQSNGIQLKYQHLIQSDNINQNELDKQLTQEVKNFQEVQCPSNLSSDITRKFFIIKQMCQFCVNIEDKCRYLNKGQKFNWNEFFFTIHRGTAQELMKLLS